MSAIAGIVYTDGRPAQAEALAPAVAELAPFGPDGLSLWAEGSAALAHLALHSTPEAQHERWPLRGASGALLLADARLDNRDELQRALRPPARDDGPLTDAQLIMAAHERWGDEAPAQLIGDFAYVLWEPATRTLRLVRSPFGLKPLFFRVDGERVLFASSLRALLALEPRATLNEPWLASFLAMSHERAAELSAFKEIQKVPPAHLLRLEPARRSQSSHRFWQPPSADGFRGWSEAEWEESFRERFEQAVAASLRSAAPIAMSVSGGQDSSAIALLAHRMMHERPSVPARPVFAYTLRMPEWPDTDESRYRNAATERLPHFHTEWIDVARAWEWESAAAWHRQMSAPSIFPNACMFRPFYERARAEGCRVKVSGLGGDIVTGGEDYGNFPALLSYPKRHLLRELPYFTGNRLGSYKRVAGMMANRYLPRLFQQWRRLRAKPTTLISEAGERLAATVERPIPVPDGFSPHQQNLWNVLTSPFYTQIFEQRAELIGLYGMELRCPFYDRRLVEMALHQPLPLRIAGGVNRVLLKRALANEMPPLLRERTSKADFTRFTVESVPEADRARALALPPDGLLRQQGWVDMATWEQWANAPARLIQINTLYRAAFFEQWYNTLVAQQACLLQGEKAGVVSL